MARSAPGRVASVLAHRPRRTVGHDPAEVCAEENLDGKFLLRTPDPTLSAQDIAVGYKLLLEVERRWRDMKSSLDLRPVFRLEDRIRADVGLCCWPRSSSGSPRPRPVTAGGARATKSTRSTSWNSPAPPAGSFNAASLPAPTRACSLRSVWPNDPGSPTSHPPDGPADVRTRRHYTHKLHRPPAISVPTPRSHLAEGPPTAPPGKARSPRQRAPPGSSTGSP